MSKPAITNWNIVNMRDVQIPYISDAGFQEFKALPGKVIVEMCIKPETSRGLILPEVLQGKVRADIGVVLACTPPDHWIDAKGEKYDLPNAAMDIMPGDVVMVRPDDGDWFMAGWETQTYRTSREIRCYGVHGDPSLYQITNGRMGEEQKWDRGSYEIIWWSESIVARIVGNEVVPTHGNIVVHPLRSIPDLVELPEGTNLPTTESIVDQVSRHSDHKRGQRLCYQPDPTFDLRIGDDDQYIVRESQILSLVEA